MKSLSRVRLFATPWTAAHQAPPSVEFSQAKLLEWAAIALRRDKYADFSSHIPGFQETARSYKLLVTNTLFYGEGNGTPLQYSCLENPMDGGAWWAAVHGRVCSPCREWDMTEQLHFHFSLSCIGEGNGNPLQCSFLENPRDRGAWCAAIYGVAQSRT